MKKREAQTLILRYMGNCTPEERRLVETYFMDYLQSSEELPLPDQIEAHQKEMWSSLEAYISPHQMITPNGRAGISRRYRNGMGIWIAAAAIASFESIRLNYKNTIGSRSLKQIALIFSCSHSCGHGDTGCGTWL